MDAPAQRAGARPPQQQQTLGNENALGLQHQQKKSVGTLSKMPTANSNTTNAVNGVPKRSVMGDVTNNAKTVHADRVGKQEVVKVQAIPDDKFLNKKAQRPYANGPKHVSSTISTTSSTSSTTEVNAVSAITKAPVAQAQILVKKPTAPKKGPVIYQDAVEPVRPATSHANSVAPVVEAAPLRQHKSEVQLKEPAPVHYAPSNSNALAAGSNNQSTIAEYADKAVVPRSSLAMSKQKEVLAVEKPHNDAAEKPRELPLPPITSSQVPPLPSSQAPHSEPEDWDEEEDDYEAGFTTTSYQDRRDNTTGGVTGVVVPKVNGRVKQELANAKFIVESSRSMEDIEDEAWDTSMVAEYGDEIFSYMRELEIKMLPNAHYMDNQAEIQWSMRSVLMDWLIQVHHRFALLPETLFLCVNYIDRFLSCKIVSLGKLQLVGATAIFVAAKYEEINCPSVNEIVYMVDGGYTVDEILKAERFMLSMLQFELGWPGPMSFLRRISKADDYDLETRTLAKYFLEVTVMDERFIGSPPSFIAAGAHAFARFMLKKGDWSPAHAFYSGYTWTQLRPLVSLMLECCQQPTVHHSAVYDKYSDRRYKRASLFVQNELSRDFVLPPVAPVVPQHQFQPSRSSRASDRGPYKG